MEIQSSNEDIITEILSRLPAKSLLRFEAVSRSWHNIISDNSFRRLQFQRNKPTFSGFFFRDTFDYSHQVKYLSIGSDQALVHHNVLDFLPEKVQLIASSNGFLSCCSCYTEEIREGSRNAFIYVCNPATKEYVQIEWPDASDYDQNYFACAFGVEDVENFKLISVEMVEDLCYLFRVYSSKTKEWKKLDVCNYRYDYSGHHGLPDYQIVFARGVVYRLTNWDVILAFDVEKEQSSLIILPVHRIHHTEGLCEVCIGKSEGWLHFIHISEAGLRVWFLNSKTKWELKHLVSLLAVEKQCPEFLYTEAKRVACLGLDKAWIIPSWIEPIVYTDGILLVKLRCSFSFENQHLETCTKIYLYNLETRMMKELCTLDKLGFHNGFLTTIPYSMSLVPLGSA